jgi:hypothetical protein
MLSAWSMQPKYPGGVLTQNSQQIVPKAACKCQLCFLQCLEFIHRWLWYALFETQQAASLDPSVLLVQREFDQNPDHTATPARRCLAGISARLRVAILISGDCGANAAL